MVRQKPMSPHRHDFLELVVILGGEGVHRTEWFEHRVAAGDLFVINRSRSHGYAATEQLSLVNVLIREDVMVEAGRAFAGLAGFHALFTLEPVRWQQRTFDARMQLEGESLELIKRRIELLETELQRAEPGGAALAKAWLFLILGELARLYGDAEAGSGQLEMRLSRVLSWMEAHYAEPADLAGLAAMAHLSERSLNRHFKMALGQSPMRYLNQLRLGKARELLRDRRQTLSVTEVAVQCGFDDPNYFTRAFRRLHGVAPTVVRSQVS